MSLWPIAVVVASLLVGANACSMPQGWRPPSVEQQILNAEEVLFGQVWRTYRDNSGRPGRHHLYTATVRVFCVLKGRQSTQIVNITDVGRFSIHLVMRYVGYRSGTIRHDILTCAKTLTVLNARDKKRKM